MVRPMRTRVLLVLLAACNGAPAPRAPAPVPRAVPSASVSASTTLDPRATVEVAAGDGFWCARRADGTVRCHGANDRGQLGGAPEVGKTGDTDVLGIANATSIVASGDNACARLADGTAKCWGGRDHGKPIDVATFPAPSVPTDVVVADAVQTETMRVDVSDGSTHTSSCALRGDGTISCWGANDLGQLGDGTTTDRAKPVRVAGITDAAEIRLEWGRACARLRDGAVKCWGDNDRGLLVPNAAQAVLKTAVLVKGVANAAHIAVGAEHACAVLRDGTLRCWGDADDMPNGWEPAVKSAPQPALIPDVARVVGIVARASETCVWRDDGRVQCWHKAGKETGLDSTWDDDNFVPWIDDAVDVAIGQNEWCARKKSGGARCWGERLYGEPTAVPGLKDATEIADGPLHACARVGSRKVRCWGWNVEGSLGVYGRGLIDDPVDVLGVDGVAHVAVGAMHSLALLGDGTVRAWRPSFGKSEVVIATVDGVRGAVEIVAGAHHACARLADGTVACWGEASKGQLGIDASPDRTPVVVPGVNDAIAIAASHDFTCALRKARTLVCWGSTGQDGAKDRAPTAIAGAADVAQVAIGAGTAFAVTRSGVVLEIDAKRAAKPIDPR